MLYDRRNFSMIVLLSLLFLCLAVFLTTMNNKLYIWVVQPDSNPTTLISNRFITDIIRIGLNPIFLQENGYKKGMEGRKRHQSITTTGRIGGIVIHFKIYCCFPPFETTVTFHIDSTGSITLLVNYYPTKVIFFRANVMTISAIAMHRYHKSCTDMFYVNLSSEGIRFHIPQAKLTWDRFGYYWRSFWSYSASTVLFRIHPWLLNFRLWTFLMQINSEKCFGRMPCIKCCFPFPCFCLFCNLL